MTERPQQWWTPSGVRLRRASQRPGPWNWLFVPGGPGLGSESLTGLVRTSAVPGTAWLLDLPGDGSNRALTTVPHNPYAHWPEVLTEAAEAPDHVVLAGHSTGGMFALATPALEPHLEGLALISSAPHAGWRTSFEAYAQSRPIPEVTTAAEAYAHHPDDATLRALTLAAAPWTFTRRSLPAGRTLLTALPYNNAAVTWADTPDRGTDQEDTMADSPASRCTACTSSRSSSPSWPSTRKTSGRCRPPTGRSSSR